MSERQDMERRRTLSCLGDLELRCWLHHVENVTPEELAWMFHEKVELVRRYATEIFDDVEEGDACVGSMWDGETGDNLDEKEYYNEDA
ncbi:MAG: hypothetical protein J6K20_00035 [Thermoguttaceae bacterium]|nr:hypothetical protein [Thermoguttaceae bacterium]